MIERVSDTQCRPAWLVSGHQWVRELLADPRLSRSHPDPEHPVRRTQIPVRDAVAGAVNHLPVTW